MQIRNNSGELIGEINTAYTGAGEVITTNTMYDANSGRPVNQNISVLESNGKVTVSNIINGKLLP